jgi:hypothetical protein
MQRSLDFQRVFDRSYLYWQRATFGAVGSELIFPQDVLRSL